MPFDLEKARKDGVPDAEIAQYLSERHPEFNFAKAKAEGVSDVEISNYLSNIPEETSIRMPREEPVPKWGRDNPNLYGLAGAGKELYNKIGKPLIEAGGQIGGGIVGAPLGPGGAVVGSGLGYGAAKNMTNLIEGKKPQDIASGLIQSGKDIQTGMGYELGGRLIGKAIPGVIEKLTAPASGKMTLENQYASDLAKKYGMQLSPTDVTGSKTMGLVESLLEKMPGSTDVITTFRLSKQLEPMLARLKEMRSQGAPAIDIKELGGKIQSQVDNYLRNEKLLKGDQLNSMRSKLMKVLGTNEPYSVVGSEGKAAITARSMSANEKAKKLYEGIADALPEGETYQTPNLQKQADTLLNEYSKLPSPDSKMMSYLRWASGKTKQIPPETQAQLDALPPEIKAQFLAENPDLAGTEGKTWKTIQDFRREVSSLANKQDVTRQVSPGMKFQTTPEGRVYTILKNAADQDLKDIAQTTGGKAWAKFRAAQIFYGKQASVYKSSEIQKLIKSNPEDVIDAGFKPNGVTEVKIMKKAAQADGFLKLRQGFTNKLLGVGKADTFDPNYLRNQLKRYGDEMLSETFGKEDLSSLKQLAEKGLELDKQKPGSWILKRIAREYPDTVVDSIIGAPESKLQSNTLLRNISIIRKTIGKQESKQLSEKLFEKLMSKHQLTGMVRPITFAKTIDKYGQVLDGFYSKPKVDQLRDLASIGKRIRTAEEIAGNPSGTGQTLISWGIFRMLLRNPVTGGILTVTPKTLAKLYTSNFGIKWLTKGFKVPASSKAGLELFSKLSLIMNENNNGGK